MASPVIEVKPPEDEEVDQLDAESLPYDPITQEIQRRVSHEHKQRAPSASSRGIKSFFASLKSSSKSTLGHTGSGSLSPSTSTRSESRQSRRDVKIVHTRLHKKKNHEFNNLFLSQTLNLPLRVVESKDGEYSGRTVFRDVASGPIWTMEFSPDGQYLAAGGADKVLWIWTLLTRGLDSDSDTLTPCDAAARAAVFATNPIRVFTDHTGDILDLGWSSHGFLVSGSFDGTVRLWHPQRSGCLGVFQHPDIVTSVAFHPSDDRFFLSGSLDRNLRLWSIPDKEIAYEATSRDMVTAACFSPKGTVVVIGTYDGHIEFYDTSGLKLTDSLHVSQRSNKKGMLKVTGLRLFQVPNGAAVKLKLLVSGNESRVRVYDFESKFLDAKYKGALNNHSQAVASPSPDLTHIICPSEDGRIYIWNSIATELTPMLLNSKDNLEYESFRPSKRPSTCAVFAPEATKKLLFQYHDPLYKDVVLGDGAVAADKMPPINQLQIIVCSDDIGTIRVYRQAVGIQACGSTNILRETNRHSREIASSLWSVSTRRSFREQSPSPSF